MPLTLKLVSFIFIIIVTYMYKYISTNCWVHFFLSVYGFKADYLVLGNRLVCSFLVRLILFLSAMTISCLWFFCQDVGIPWDFPLLHWHVWLLVLPLFRPYLYNRFYERQSHNRLPALLALTIFLPHLPTDPSCQCPHRSCGADAYTGAMLPITPLIFALCLLLFFYRDFYLL